MTAAVLSAAFFFLPSCVTYYTVMPELNSDGSMTKTVYAQADSACLAGDSSSHPFLFEPGDGWTAEALPRTISTWCLDDSATYNYYAVRTFRRGDTAIRDIPASDEYARLPYLQGKERWNRRWGLFFNTYTYSCTFPGIGNTMPVHPGSCMTENELQLWFGTCHGYQGMNGVEIYNVMLSPLFDKFTHWVNECYRQHIYTTICSAASLELTPEQKEELMEWMRKKYDFYDDMLSDGKSDWFIETARRMSGISGNQAFLQTAMVQAPEWEQTMSAQEEELTAPFCYALMYKVRMPGRVTSADTDLTDNGLPVWKVDGYRLLCGDLTIEATSRKANPAGFILCGAIILLCSAVLLRRRRRR